MLKNNKGFTLVQVIVVAGLMGVLSLAFMQMTKNMSDQQNFAESKNDELELKSSIHLLLNDKRHCRVSLAGNGEKGNPENPVIFKKSENDNETEGIDISLYNSNIEGTSRTLKKFNGANNPGDNDKSKFGKLTIKSMKLIFNNPDADGALNWDYEDSSSINDVAILRVVIEKKITATTVREMVEDYNLVVNLSSGQTPESSGESRILSCHKEFLESEKENFSYPSSCSMTLSHSDNGGAFRSAVLDMNSGGFAAIRLRGDVNSDDRFRLSGNCGTGNEIDSYLQQCQLGFGWRDVTDNGSIVNHSPLPSKQYNFSFNSSATLQVSGDVNEDDSFYYRLRCPNGTSSELDDYMKEKCSICMGHTDMWYSSPEKASCKKIQSTSDSSWGRIMTSGDVGSDDALFIGFFCEGEYSPIIKKWTN